MIISFSGIDGSGKTTLLNHLKDTFQKKGFKIKTYAMYDNVTFYSKIRRFRDLFIKKKPLDKKITYDSHLIGVEDKKQFSKKIIYFLFRSLLFKRIFIIFDILIFFIFIKYSVLFKKKNTIYLFDRYLYDSLIDTLNYPNTKFSFVRIIISIIPKINYSFLILTDPKEAFERKKEFVEEYNKWRQDNYIKVFNLSKLQNNIILNQDLNNSKKTIDLKVFYNDRN